MAHTDDYLLDMLIQIGTLSREKVEEARSKLGILDHLVQNGVITPLEVLQAKAAHFGLDFVDLAATPIDSQVISVFSVNLAQMYRMIPIKLTDREIEVALADPSDLALMDLIDHFVRDKLGRELVIKMASEQAIASALEKYYPEVREILTPIEVEYSRG